MSNEIKIIKNWWLFSIAGVLLIFLGIWVYNNPIENYIGLSILFSVIMFVSGIIEITFAFSNSKMIKGWGWILSSGIFDLIIGFILITREDVTMVILPILFGIWLIFRGISQIGKGVLLKDSHYSKWGWSVFGGLLVAVFGIFVIYNPVFGSASIIIWTALALFILGIFTILFSLAVKKLHSYLKNN